MIEFNKDEVQRDVQQLSKIISTVTIDPIKALETKIDKEDKEPKTSKSDLIKLLDNMNKNPILNNSLMFGFSDEESILLVQIRDKKTDDLIRQYPSEQFLTRLRYYREHIGILLDGRV